ncbi:MAG: hypothetical protein V3U96_07235 [Paracoccaceae bacterium]
MFADGMRKKQFQDRLKKVAAGGANTTTQMYAGVKESSQRRKRYETRTTLQDTSADQNRPGPGFLVSLVTGLLIGAGAVILARYVRFRLTGGTIIGPDADLLMAVDIVLAITAAIILRMVFRIKTKVHGISKLVGVVATVLLMHNAVHLVPGLFERIYSVQWVSQIITGTTPLSILVAGTSYDLSDQATSTNQVPVEVR